MRAPDGFCSHEDPAPANTQHPDTRAKRRADPVTPNLISSLPQDRSCFLATTLACVPVTREQVIRGWNRTGGSAGTLWLWRKFYAAEEDLAGGVPA